ncbi:TPA: hypothetical protein NJ917_002734 [Vibrio parahaemolyticus]|nr:hypothetical protein [Vibrio parahaemolyticus]
MQKLNSANKVGCVNLISLILIIIGPNFGSGLDISTLALFFLAIYYIKDIKLNVSIEVIAVFIAVIIALSSAVFNSEFNTSFIIKPIKLLVLFTVIYSIRLRINIDECIRALVISGLINSLVIYFQFLGLIDWINPQMVLHFDATFRKPGLFAGYPDAGLVSAFSSILALTVYLSNKNTKWLITSLVIGVSVIFTSRMALLLFIFSLLVIIGIQCTFKVRMKLLFYSLCSFFILHTLISLFIEDELIETVSNFSFELFINFFENGNLSTASSDDLISNHFHLPTDLLVFLFGNSIEPFTSPGEYFSDVFYIRTLWGVGFFSLLLYIIVFLTIFIKVFNSSCFYRTVALSTLIMMIIACFKGPYFFSRGFGEQFILLYFIVILNPCTNYERKENSPYTSHS